MDIKAIIMLAAMAFAYFKVPAPTIQSITPGNVPKNAKISVIVTGTHFGKDTRIKLIQSEMEVAATDLKVLSETQLACTIDLKDKPAGSWDVVVTNTYIKAATLGAGLTVGLPAPAVSAVEPKQAYNNALVTVEISGTNFRSNMGVSLETKQLELKPTQIKVLSESKIAASFDINGVGPGSYAVKAINEEGSVGILPASFTVTTPPPLEIPEILAVSPNRGFTNGSILTAIKGAYFKKGSMVKLIRSASKTEIPGLNVKVEDPKNITCFFDIAGQPVGAYDLVVTDTDGKKTILENGFTAEAFVSNSPELNQLLRPIYYELNNAELRTNQLPNLDFNAGILKSHPNLYILLGGHADERGSKEYNLELSKRRTQSVMKFLTERGISPARVVIYSYGKDHPMKKGHDETAWAFNRRVDVMVWEAPPKKEQGLATEVSP